MSLLPKSKKARRRLMAVAVAAPILALAVGLSLYAMGDAAVFFYSPSDAKAKNVPAGKVVRIGGLVQPGSVKKHSDGRVEFAVTDNVAVAPISYQGDLPDLFREGQGIVAQGSFDGAGVFEAREVLAKHDEKYMPKEVSDALKKSGEWNRGVANP
ncbi:MAG: cytochrome c biogenesis protein CcmE [Caulobacterales bacterium 32-69-10]|nr:MAG: cytochrome c biogenesis protein CcmE [Caulobacterales bacterium 32-69-10]